MEIKYEFVTGEVLEIEVEDSMGEVLLEFEIPGMKSPLRASCSNKRVTLVPV